MKGLDTGQDWKKCFLNLRKKIFFRCAIIFCVLLLLPACEDDNIPLVKDVVARLHLWEQKPPPPGTLASVNGEHISFHAVQVLMDSRLAAPGLPQRPSFAAMQERYADALTVLITHALVRQDLAARGMGITAEEVNNAIAGIRQDYGGNSLGDVLAESYLREEDWKQLMADHLALQTFTNRILLPSIRISREEIRTYYKEHVNEFKTPETWQICLHSGESREVVDAWCKNLTAEQGSGQMTQCQAVTARDIPAAWQGDFKKLKNLTCGKILESDGSWQTMAVIAKNPAKTFKASEIYPIIEHTLQRQKLAGAFDAWVAEKLAASDVKVSPEVFRPAK